MNAFLSKKINLIHLLILSLLVALITFGLTNFYKKYQLDKQASSVTSNPVCKYDVKRLNGLKYIKPIMFVDEECQSDNLVGIKQRLTEIINRYQTIGDVTSASVYIREYANSEWAGVNEDEKYQPGSLFKVPLLITILKMNENNHGFLNKVVSFDKSFDIEKNVAYTDKSIKLGQKYTIKELLNYMIKYSDNNATALLQQNMKIEIFKKLFSDIGLEAPSESSNQYLVSVKEYSLFMRAIYNAAYLTIDDSEYAAELLTQCDFKDGIVKGLPAKTSVAHKFGESGDMSEKQLHESAIVYLDSKPYLLTIMTKGKENQKLCKLIAEISQAVYLDMSNSSATTM